MRHSALSGGKLLSLLLLCSLKGWVLICGVPVGPVTARTYKAFVCKPLVASLAAATTAGAAAHRQSALLPVCWCLKL